MKTINYFNTQGISPFTKKLRFYPNFKYYLNLADVSDNDESWIDIQFYVLLAIIDEKIIENQIVVPEFVTIPFQEAAFSQNSYATSYKDIIRKDDEGIFIQSTGKNNNKAIYYSIRGCSDGNIAYIIEGIDQVNYRYCISIIKEDRIIPASYGVFSLEDNSSSYHAISNHYISMKIETLEDEFIELSQTVINLLLFKKTVNEKIKNSILGNTTHKNQSIYSSDVPTNAPYKKLDARWYTTIINENPIPVKGHLRKQRIGKGRMQFKEIFINQFVKNGYTRFAQMKKSA
jgi:hypothetical protein